MHQPLATWYTAILITEAITQPAGDVTMSLLLWHHAGVHWQNDTQKLIHFLLHSLHSLIISTRLPYLNSVPTYYAAAPILRPSGPKTGKQITSTRKNIQSNGGFYSTLVFKWNETDRETDKQNTQCSLLG